MYLSVDIVFSHSAGKKFIASHSRGRGSSARIRVDDVAARVPYVLAALSSWASLLGAQLSDFIDLWVLTKGTNLEATAVLNGLNATFLGRRAPTPCGTPIGFL